MIKARKALYWSSTSFLGICLLFIVVWESLLYLQRPAYQGIKHLTILEKEVQVYWDGYGVPYIQAQTQEDAFRALGYITAKERLFQMDMLRRVARGKLSEILGSSLVDVDKMFRALRIEKWAKEYDAKEEKIYPQAWKLLDAYIQGINFFIQNERPPIEYTILLTKPEEFSRVDTLASLAYMGFSFAEGLRSDPLYSLFEEKIQGLDVSILFPRYDLEKENAAILEDQPEIPRISKIQYPNYKLKKKNLEPNAKIENILGNPKTNNHSISILLDFVNFIFQKVPVFEGSNSWLLSPNRSITNFPILANDPHIGYANPGTWMEARIDAPDLQLYGYFLPGTPFPLLGNTDTKAWGLTMLENDDMDLYYETISEDGKKFLNNGKWMELEVWEEEIQIRGGKKETFQVQKTPRGTIFTNFIKGYEGRPISIYWVFHEGDNPLNDILYGLVFSKSMKEFRENASRLLAPGLNISYADREGNIAWYGAGRYVIRGKNANSRKILEGTTDKDKVLGLLPFDKNPKLENPPGGIIITANNLSSRKEIIGYGKVEGNWQPSDRFLRIKELLSHKEKFSLDDMKDIQLDVFLYSAPQIWEQLIHAVDWDSPIWKNYSKKQVRLAFQAWEILSNWDFEFKNDSRGATVYSVWSYFILKNIIQPRVGEELYLQYASIAEPFQAFKALMDNPQHPLWDDPNTNQIQETRDIRIMQSLMDAVLYLENHVSQSPALWHWKNLYSLEFKHPLGMIKPLNYLFNIGPFPVDGGTEVINNIKTHFFKGEYKARSGPSTRRIVSFHNLDENLTILPIGNSGNLRSPYYKNQKDLYLNGEYRITLFSKKAWEKEKSSEMKLVPLKN